MAITKITRDALNDGIPADKAADGSASSPGISFSGDTNTGIYRTAGDKIAITTGGTERMRVTDSSH